MTYKTPSFSNLIVGIFISNNDYQLIDGCFSFWNITHFLEFWDFLENRKFKIKGDKSQDPPDHFT